MKVFIRNFDECFVLQDFVHAFPHLDTYRQELKKFMELRKAVNVRYAENIDLSEYKLSLVKILDQYVDAHEAELLTMQINITDREQFEEAVENLGSDKSKAEAIAAQTNKITEEKMDSDPEFYERFSKKITEIIEKMRQGKLADIEALKELRMIRDHVIEKKDDDLPELIQEKPGADVIYRNIKQLFSQHEIDEERYVQIVLDIFDLLHREAIVDWYKNIDVKRKMMNSIDDYLYDVVKNDMGVDIENDEMPKIIETIMQLAENNFEIFS
jgi:type I restriction enzyme R subunit